MSNPRDRSVGYWESFHNYAAGSRYAETGGMNETSYKDWSRGTHFQIGASPRTKRGEAVVTLSIGGNTKQESEARFDALYRSRESIERALGFAAVWDRKDQGNIKRCSISVYGGPDSDDRANWPWLHAWTLYHLEAFDRVFHEHIKDLK